MDYQGALNGGRPVESKANHMMGARAHAEHVRDDELKAMRIAAWREQGIAMIRLSDVIDPVASAIIQAEAKRLYGPRPLSG